MTGYTVTLTVDLDPELADTPDEAAEAAADTILDAIQREPLEFAVRDLASGKVTYRLARPTERTACTAEAHSLQAVKL